MEKLQIAVILTAIILFVSFTAAYFVQTQDNDDETSSDSDEVDKMLNELKEYMAFENSEHDFNMENLLDALG